MSHYTSPDPTDAEDAGAPSSPASEHDQPRESRRAHASRMAHRTRLHIYSVSAVAVLVYVVALATSNTGRVRVDWLFASMRIPLIWLTVFAAILGWLLGILITMLFRLRTLAPRHQAGETPTPGA